jgi:hypothetical protein
MQEATFHECHNIHSRRHILRLHWPNVASVTKLPELGPSTKWKTNDVGEAKAQQQPEWTERCGGREWHKWRHEFEGPK